MRAVDVIEGRVSLASAEADYGVVFGQGIVGERPVIDEVATKALRAGSGTAGNIPRAMIDRGEGYEKMLRGEHRPRMR